jgi:hypothetical protein
MTEIKETMSNSIGVTRMNHLEAANVSLAQGNLAQCKTWIENFVDTIDGETEAGKQLKKEFDKIYLNKKNIEKAAEEKTKDMGWLEKHDFTDMISQELSFDTIRNLKSSCWVIFLKYKLFDGDETTK